MKKISCIIFLLSSLIQFGIAQINGALTPFYLQNNYLNNPASISPKNVSFGVVGSLKNTDFSTSNAFVAYANMPVYQQQVGAGIRFSSREIGQVETRTVEFGASYNLLLAGDTLNFGLELGFNQSTFSLTDLFVEDETDPFFLGEGNNEFNQIFNLGIFFSPKNYQFSVVIKNLRSTVVSSDEGEGYVSIWGARKFRLSDQIVVKPTAKVDKFINRSPIYSLGAESIYSKIGGIGASYISVNIVSVQAYVFLNRYFKIFDPVELGYAYNHNLSNETFYHQLTHQFFINYSLRKKPQNRQVKKSNNSVNPNYY